jgi:peptidoglycan/xylan/chitin deacetylase (PgdA/CDA1 family)
LARSLLRDELPDRSVVVTFDDGYADNLHNAKPLLERYSVPATFFLTTGYLGREREFWWDELDRLLLQPGTLPEVLRMNIGGNSRQWELGEAAHYREQTALRNRDWRAWEGDPSPRHALYKSLWELLHHLPVAEQRRVLSELLEWTSATPVGRPTHRLLSPEEVVALAEGTLVEVGAHTVTHPALSALPQASQWDEILESKTHLEEILDRPVTGFSYPYGRRSDYDAGTVRMVRKAGFAYSCSNFGGAVGRTTDPFQIPRAQVQDWDGDEFARRLRRWFDD